tara:strand:- start:2268 stop:2786 length:519 start_codon:yes stop_codon:yes gene_type:complete
VELDQLKRHISSYKDFPKKGIVFRDVLEILQDPNIFKNLIKKMSNVDFLLKSDAIISIDARGFIFGSAISLYTSKPLIFARKPGKLPGELVSSSYDLEYGQNNLSIQKKSMEKFNSYVIVDDLIATGGTVNCVYEILKSQNKQVNGLIVVAEIETLDARSKLPFDILSQIKI